MPFSFKEWYELNGKRLNESRRDRYHTDPDYRDRVLKTNQESRKVQKRPSRAKKDKTETKRWKTVEIDGVQEELLSIGAVAEELGCSIQAIRLWEKQAIIPATPYRGGPSKTGDRLYTRALIAEMRKILKAQGRIGGVKRSEPSSARPLKRYVRLANGETEVVSLFLIGALAEALGRKVSSIEQLEARGAIPATPFRATSVGRRLYTADMISAAQEAFHSKAPRLRSESEWKLVHDTILEHWTAQNIIGAVLIEAVPSEKDTANGEDARS